MGIEVEVKAHVRDFEKVKHLLPQPLVRIEKSDLYWAREGKIQPLFRTRFQTVEGKTGNVLFTYKEDHRKDGFEANREYEFLAEGGQWEQIHTFFTKIGYHVVVKKHKQGFVSQIPDTPYEQAHVELWDVEKLGHFVEIEFVVSRNEEIPEAKKALERVLETLGISPSDIEPRRYTELLQEL